MGKTYQTANSYCRAVFGCKVYKLALSAALTCPNRDGTVGTGGCIFCSAGGSGDFAAPACQPIGEQIETARRILGKKGENRRYLAYFQGFTGTYGDLKYLEARYQAAIDREDILGLSIATRPDCLGPEALAMLGRLSEQKPLWVELGLQTVHPETARFIRRGYELEVYDKAMTDLKALGVHRITHVILGLPGESRQQMLETLRYAGARTDGIKLQLLHVLEHTDLAEHYRRGEFATLEKDEYCDLVAECIDALPPNVVIHRMTGDGAKKDLIAPLWSADKKRVLNDLNRALARWGLRPEST